ncbi:MAG: M16 family metallopeptidase [Planctomycetaceae bacterium]
MSTAVQFRQHQLANGLEIVAECNPGAYSASMAFFVRTGSRDENDLNSGVSHFLEHMVFKGTPKRSAADVNRRLDEISSGANAYTSEEQTVYYATTLPEDVPNLLELLADIMRPSLRTEDFDTEKKVILEEIAKYDDQPPYGAHEKCMAAHFVDHPLARSILGTVQSVGALTSTQMMEYFQSRYSPKNIVLSAAGNIDFEKLVALADQYCGPWPMFDAPRALPVAAKRSSFHVVQKPLASQAYVVQTSNAPAAEDDDRYAARVLGTILGDDTGSRMFWEMVDTGLAEYAVFGPHEYQGTGVFFTSMSCAPEEVAANLQRIKDIFCQAEADGVTSEELEQAKNKICAQMILSSERPANRMFSVGNSWLQRRQYKTIREGVQAYRDVTLKDIRRVLEKYPISEPTTVVIGPMDKIDQPE